MVKKALRNNDGAMEKYRADRTFYQETSESTIQRGQLVGIKNQPIYNVTRVRKSFFDGKAERIRTGSFNIHQAHGGGVLGDPAYFMLNGSNKIRSNSNGALNVTRTLSKQIIKQFLCRDLPVIRPGDEAAYVHPEGTSPLPFRNGNSCMRCHATMDQMAKGYRNLRLNMTDGESTADRNKKNLKVAFVEAVAPSMPAEDMNVWVDEPDKNFHNRPSNGRLYMRDFDGNLIDKSYSSLEEFGQIIGDMDDTYVCTASKYFNFLTGVKVYLHDIDDITTVPLDSKQMEYRNLVIKLGRDLKKHQSLKTLISDIINTKAYLKPGIGVE